MGSPPFPIGENRFHTCPTPTATPQYWQMIRKESKEGGDMIASRRMFEESERRHPVREAEKIKIESIRGKIVFVGAEDDVLWDTCKYIRRMDERLKSLPHESEYEMLLYRHGTHFVFPEEMIKRMFPVGSSLFDKNRVSRRPTVPKGMQGHTDRH